MSNWHSKTYDEMSKEELWNEIKVLVDSANYTDTDKELFLNLIKEWGKRNNEKF